MREPPEPSSNIFMFVIFKLRKGEGRENDFSAGLNVGT